MNIDSATSLVAQGKKLGKKQVLDCDIESVCLNITRPEGMPPPPSWHRLTRPIDFALATEPLALRLSASLLLGVARAGSCCSCALPRLMVPLSSMVNK